MAKVLEGIVAPPSRLRAGVPPSLDAIVLQCLSRAPDDRLRSCAALADAIGGAVAVASPHEVAEWVSEIGSDFLNERGALLRAVEDGRVGAFASSRSVASEGTTTLPANDLPARGVLGPRDPSQPSTRSEAPVARPLRAAIAFSALLALVIVVGVVWSVWRSLPHVTNLGIDNASTVTRTLPSVEVVATQALTPSASPAASSSDDARPPTSSASQGSTRSPRPTTPKPRPDPCRPRYVTGPDGIRRVKPECL
jgi:serine/threonine-protein kinase